ncbi:hypothetical protein NL676_031900 [Syzygium grande]|nr:hypothetical protein NL676_031900 [Syzygium grande]
MTQPPPSSSSSSTISPARARGGREKTEGQKNLSDWLWVGGTSSLLFLLFPFAGESRVHLRPESLILSLSLGTELDESEPVAVTSPARREAGFRSKPAGNGGSSRPRRSGRVT